MSKLSQISLSLLALSGTIVDLSYAGEMYVYHMIMCKTIVIIFNAYSGPLAFFQKKKKYSLRLQRWPVHWIQQFLLQVRKLNKK